jgi:hypothetical protein
MSPIQHKLCLAGAFAALATLALAVSCTGFFVGDTLQSIAVGPASVNVPVGATQQMTATGTYTPSGNTKTINGISGIVWTSSDASAMVGNTGLVTGVSTGTPTITAAVGTVSGQASINIVLSNVTSIVITPSSQNVSQNGGFNTFTAMANVSGQSQQVDVSAQAVWTISNPGNFTLTQNVTPETVTTTSTATLGEIETLTATYTSGTTQYTATAKVTVTQ